MWTGGVRVVLPDEAGRILMVRQSHEGNDIWMVPGGGIEENENAAQAAVREVQEETGLIIKVKRLLWHVEEVSEQRGQRFVNFFLGEITGGELGLGSDPEFDENGQVLREVRFLSRKEIMNLKRVYPEYLRTELWEALEPGHYPSDVFRIRK
ncbi:MAG: hydrolase [Bacillota bacterium]|jgi:ADP-ribose pyrophosphatase YjhB (NUDIX family)|nr:hydrolase [Bacillota bacterium]